MSTPTTPGFNGDRLREARVHQGYTQAQLGEAADVSATTISYYERGENTPRPDTFERICKELKFPQRYFINSPSNALVDVESVVFWRALHSVPRKVREGRETMAKWLGHMAAFVAKYVEMPEINMPDFGIDDPFQLSLEDVEELADKTRKYWGLGAGPISNVAWLLENQGCIVSRLALGCEKMDGFSFWAPVCGSPCIVLNTDKSSAVRSRFDAAHELAHLILHRNVERRELGNAKKYKELEAQAHRFAGAFLFPAESFIREARAINLDLLQSLKMRWRCSIGVMVRRAKDLETIGDRQYRNLQVGISRRKWRMREPLDDELEAERPELLGEAFRIIVENGVVSRSHVLDLLPYGAHRVERLAGLPMGFLTDDEWGQVLKLKTPTRASKSPANKTADVISFPTQ